MYKVTYYLSEQKTTVGYKIFPTLGEAELFYKTLPEDSILEIKYYDNSITDISDKSNINRCC